MIAPLQISRPMLDAIRAGGNAEAWRLIEPQPVVDSEGHVLWDRAYRGLAWEWGTPSKGLSMLLEHCPFGQVGNTFKAEDLLVAITALDVVKQDAGYCWHITLMRAPMRRRRK